MSTIVPGDDNLKSSLERDPRWKLVERIVATPGFAKSARLSTFLLHIVQQSLSGNNNALTEQLIGERIFERPIGYDPRDDNIVRSHARRLRQRLKQYFQEEGRAEPFRVSIPRGTYVPLFDRVENKPSEFTQQAHVSSIEDAPLPDISSRRKQGERWRIGISCSLVFAVMFFAFAAIQIMRQDKRPSAEL